MHFNDVCWHKQPPDNQTLQFLHQVSQQFWKLWPTRIWMSISVTFSLHRNYIYNEVSQNKKLFCSVTVFVYWHFLYMLCIYLVNILEHLAKGGFKNFFRKKLFFKLVKQFMHFKHKIIIPKLLEPIIFFFFFQLCNWQFSRLCAIN